MEFDVQELRLVGVSEDGANLLLADGDGGRYTLAIDDELRTTIRRDRREPASADKQAAREHPLRPRDVQGLIRGGVPLEEIAERAGWTLEKVQRYEGPIRAERDYVSELAQRVQLFGRGESTTLRERADRRLAERGVEAERVVWDSWKNDDTHWTVIVRFPAGGRQREATWLFDPVNRSLRTVDDEARWLGGDEIPPADEDSPERQRAAARKQGRPHRDAPVYDVEAEGGLVDAQDPHLGARLTPQEPGAGDPAEAMRARQAGRGRARSAPRPGTASATSPATQLPDLTPVERTERIDVGATPPPLSSHPSPQEVHEDAARTQGDAAMRAQHDDAEDTAFDDAADDVASSAPAETGTHDTHGRGSRRRKTRRPRARVDRGPVTDALTEDDDETDESLFVELPGHHDGGDDDAFDDGAHDAEGRDDDENGDVTSREDVDGAADDAGRDTVTPTGDADAAGTKRAKPAGRAVPQRPSQSRKSSRPSVPSWDDIMFGGRGPKR